MVMFRILAIGYVLWMLKDVVKGYFAGGPEAPSGVFVLCSVLILGAGCVWIGVMTYRQWKQMKEAARIYNEEVARQYAEEERLEAERKALEEEYPDDGEYYEESSCYRNWHFLNDRYQHNFNKILHWQQQNLITLELILQE